MHNVNSYRHYSTTLVHDSFILILLYTRTYTHMYTHAYVYWCINGVSEGHAYQVSYATMHPSLAMRPATLWHT